MARTLDRALAACAALRWWCVVLLAHDLRLIHIVLPCLKTTALHARLWFCHSLEWLCRIDRSGWRSAAFGFFSWRYRSRLTAVWNPAGGFRSAVGRRLYPEPRQVVVSFHCSHISFALPDPIQGQSATSLRTDDLFYTATACGGLVFTQPCLLQELRGDRRSAHPVAAFCCDGMNYIKRCFICQHQTM